MISHYHESGKPSSIQGLLLELSRWKGSPQELVAAAGLAQANRELIADEIAMAAGKDGWTAAKHAR